MARALAEETNLQDLARTDADDRGLRDIWEALVFTGRRFGEVLEARLDCTSRINGIRFFWHEQTKVGNLDEAIRIPERLFGVRIRCSQSCNTDRSVRAWSGRFAARGAGA
ncbi:hypothetical protein [Streptomyces sp. NPDC040750]|uniref:hypothetical protein n=1 Tax=Streptomyces sp. NPDC040750 TaxID=3154491 RepID=UPI0033D499BD